MSGKLIISALFAGLIQCVATAQDADTDKLVWHWFDSNIRSQERLVASNFGQMLSGADIGQHVAVSRSHKLLFREQVNLLYEIKKSKNLTLAKQYMLVHTLMTLDNAETSRRLVPPDDPRQAGISQQIKTAKELLSALRYTKHESAPSDSKVDGK